MIKKKIIILTSEYPTNDNPLGGIFVKDSNLALSKYTDNDITVFYNYFISLRKVNFSNFFLFLGKKLFFKEKKIKNYFTFLISPYFNLFKLLIDRRITTRLLESYIKKNGKPDLIISHFTYPVAHTAKYIYKKFNIPYMIIEHSTGYFTNLFTHYQLNKIETSMRYAKIIITVSSFLKKKLDKIFSLKNTVTIGNVIDFEKFKITAKTKSKKIRFIVICELVKKKQIGKLLEIFNSINNKYEFHLNIVGDGLESKQLKNYVITNQLSKKISFKGTLNRNQISNLMRKVDYLISCSLIETFGISICESLSSGTPVLVLDSGGPRDFLTNKNSIFVKSFKALKVEIIKVLEKKAKTFSRKNLRSSIKKKFDPIIIARKLDFQMENLLK